MEIRTALLKTANLFETKPASFDINATDLPDCGTPGCILGWVGVMLGDTNKAWWWTDSVYDAMGINKGSSTGAEGDGIFYERMRVLGWAWADNAADCARTLRLYADRYHPATESYPVILKELDRLFKVRVAA